MATKTYAPKIPFDLDASGNIANISDALQNCKQNMRMVIMTNPGEKLMDPLFGAGIRKLLFDNQRGNSYDMSTGEITERATSLIKTQADKYLPDVIIKNIEAVTDNQTLSIKIHYLYKGYYPDYITVGLAG
jgi:hypothetical protein